MQYLYYLLHLIWLEDHKEVISKISLCFYSILLLSAVTRQQHYRQTHCQEAVMCEKKSISHVTCISVECKSSVYLAALTV